MKLNRWKAVPAGFAAALVILVKCSNLPAAAKPAPAAKQAVDRRDGALVATAAAPQFPGPLTSPCPDSAPCADIELVERQMLELVNADRLDPANRAETGGGAKPLKWDPRLTRAARAQSEGMAARSILSHYDPNGDSPVERIYRAGVQWVAVGENIAQDFTVAAAESALMNEPRFQENHRGNILSKKFNAIGIGVARAPNGRLYITQDFAEEP
ncbi:MAG TPA: CAP domain-containing protein [Terriglobia bacterium]|nr:CAP domain-containing protein [Terriglobia bacterium]